jgi:hypothetical protein
MKKFKARKENESWILHAYYTFIYYVFGVIDADGNPNTVEYQGTITAMLRRGKDRTGVFWYFLSTGTLVASFEWIRFSWFGWWLFGSVPLFAFLFWLYIHVLYPYRMSRQ